MRVVIAGGSAAGAMTALLLAVALTFGLDFQAGGILPSLVLLICFVPFVWGLGLVAAATIVTFRRGGGLVGFAMSILGLASGASATGRQLALPDGGRQWIRDLSTTLVLDLLRRAILAGA